MTHHAEMTALDVMGAGAAISVDGWTTDLVTGERTPFISEYEHGYSEAPCGCGQHWDLHKQNRRCLACNASPGLWRSIARENAIDDRERIANDLAEEIEEREREEEEWEAQQMHFETEGEKCPPF